MTQSNTQSPSPSSSSSPRTALIVIDVQESFRHRPYFDASQMEPFFARLNELIAGFKARKLPVVRIFHVEESGAFAHASGWVKPMPEVAYEPDVTFEKHVHSALAGTGLPAWLAKRGISRLVVSGIRSEQCCETTTRHASDSGYEVDYVTEATQTFPMKSAQGRVFSPEEIKERTELVLDGRFATICTVKQALERAV